MPIIPCEYHSQQTGSVQQVTATQSRLIDPSNASARDRPGPQKAPGPGLGRGWGRC